MIPRNYTPLYMPTHEARRFEEARAEQKASDDRAIRNYEMAKWRRAQRAQQAQHANSGKAQ